MINIILTVWKRNNLEEQLQAIYNQTADISDVYVYQNESHQDITHLKEKFNFKHVHSKHMNFKFHGRFTLPLLFTSKYTAIFDDDTIPNSKWLEHCVKICEEKNCIVGANGRNYSGNGNTQCCGSHKDILSDIVGHCWFFKTKWIHYMWRESAPTFENGEDIHFCAACKLHGNIDSYVASGLDPKTWGDTKIYYGADEHASYKKTDHSSTRNKLFEYWITKGWNTR
jgi:hypothetical protein